MDDLKLKKGDFVAIGLVLLMALILMLLLLFSGGKQDTLMVEIYRNGEMEATIPLSRDGEYIVEGDYTNHISIKDGEVTVTASNCPGSDCVHSGSISDPGRSIVCLPNKMELRLTGADGDIDAVAG